MLLERTISIIMIAFSTFFLVMSFQIENRTGDLIAPGSWPGGLMIIMLILSVILCLRTFSAKANQNILKTANEEAEDLANDDEKLVYPVKFFYLIAALAVYALLLNYVGFIVDSILLIFALTLIFGIKKWVKGLLTAILATAGAVMLFPILLSTPFPRGVGIFQSFSLLFF